MEVGELESEGAWWDVVEGEVELRGESTVARLSKGATGSKVRSCQWNLKVQGAVLGWPGPGFVRIPLVFGGEPARTDLLPTRDHSHQGHLRS